MTGYSTANTSFPDIEELRDLEVHKEGKAMILS